MRHPVYLSCKLELSKFRDNATQQPLFVVSNRHFFPFTFTVNFEQLV